MGGGPAGLMAAQRLAEAGCAVVVHEHTRVPGRKFVMAGRGGLNLTNDEPLDVLLDRYDDAMPVRRAVARFTATDLRRWAAKLDEPTFVGSSGRVFPESMHARPLLRAWLARLDELGVTFEHHRLVDVSSDADPNGTARVTLHFDDERMVHVDAVVLALGGASWPGLGADGSWTAMLGRRGVDVTPLLASNCGWAIQWSGEMARHAGTPLKNIAVRVGTTTVRGEAMITSTGIEGGAIYALGRALRDEFASTGHALLHLNLRPTMRESTLRDRYATQTSSASFSNRLRKLGLSPAAAAIVRKTIGDRPRTPEAVARAIVDAVLDTTAPMPIERAISTAGGVSLDAVDDTFMLVALPNVYAVGEMLDWDAPTGGYLLQACFSTAVAAADAIVSRAVVRSSTGTQSCAP